VRRWIPSPADGRGDSRVEHDGEIQEAGPRRDVRDVRDLQPIWAGRRELAVDEIGAGRAVSSRTVVWNGFRGSRPARRVRMSRATRWWPHAGRAPRFSVDARPRTCRATCGEWRRVRGQLDVGRARATVAASATLVPAGERHPGLGHGAA